MRKLIVVVSIALLTAGVAMATSDGETIEITNLRNFGPCVVSSKVDMLTDETWHILECSEESAFDETRIGVVEVAATGRLEIYVSKGSNLHFDDRMPIVFRIDKNKVVRGDWLWDGENMLAFSRDTVMANVVLNQLSSGKKVMIQVEDERGVLDLSGANGAVEEFRRRTE